MQDQVIIEHFMTRAQVMTVAIYFPSLEVGMTALRFAKPNEVLDEIRQQQFKRNLDALRKRDYPHLKDTF